VNPSVDKKPKVRKLTPAQLAQKKKDEIYLANLAKYRAEQAKKNKEAALKAARTSYAQSEMPDLYGLSLRRTMEICAQRGIIPTVQGHGAFVLKQSPAPGTKLTENSTCTVWLTDTLPAVETDLQPPKE